MLARAKKTIDKLLELALIILMGANVLNVLWQVFTRFVLKDPSSFTEELARQEKELAIYMFFVVYRMFQKNAGEKIRKISAEEIIESYEYNEGLMERLEGVHEKFLSRIATTEISRQPYVMKYVTETLVEAPEDEEPVPLTEEGMGVIFLLLKTVVDLLDKTAGG